MPYSVLDIIDEHRLETNTKALIICGRCSCGGFSKMRRYSGPVDQEGMKDMWLKHVQQARDAIRGKYD